MFLYPNFMPSYFRTN